AETIAIKGNLCYLYIFFTSQFFIVIEREDLTVEFDLSFEATTTTTVREVLNKEFVNAFFHFINICPRDVFHRRSPFNWVDDINIQSTACVMASFITVVDFIAIWLIAMCIQVILIMFFVIP